MSLSLSVQYSVVSHIITSHHVSGNVTVTYLILISWRCRVCCLSVWTLACTLLTAHWHQTDRPRTRSCNNIHTQTMYISSFIVTNRHFITRKLSYRKHDHTPLLYITPLVSPKLPHVPLRVGEWSLGYEERRCCANCPCSSQDFPPMWSWCTNVTDTQMDRRHAIAILHFAL